ncbi:MAG TPA: hypothetical protein PLQ15_01930 [Syntrophales bacterium]|nr:hypothetical protein [Syntrophales bacterium]
MVRFLRALSGEVTYGAHLITGRKLMAGPFPGPRTAQDRINGDCPRWRCDSEGRCLTGAAPRMPEGRPLEVPPDGPSTGSPPGPWGTPPGGGAGGGTMPPPSETKTPDHGVDSKALRDEYFKKCTAMRDPYVKRNCTPAHSDCANAPRGCYGYVISGALPDGKSPGRVGCGRGVAENYIGCLRTCNEQFVARTPKFNVEGCGFACRDRAVEGIRACDAASK